MSKQHGDCLDAHMAFIDLLYLVHVQACYIIHYAEAYSSPVKRNVHRLMIKGLYPCLYSLINKIHAL